MLLLLTERVPWTVSSKRDENWKMTVIYGIGVAGAVALMKALLLCSAAPPAARSWGSNQEQQI
jgi:hypothetical protein